MSSGCEERHLGSLGPVPRRMTAGEVLESPRQESLQKQRMSPAICDSSFAQNRVAVLYSTKISTSRINIQLIAVGRKLMANDQKV